jgi:hypothetical protein
MINLRHAAFASVLLTCAVGASAFVSINLVEVDNSANPILDGFRTYDLFITTDDHWTTSALYLDLQQGSLYQDPWGGNGWGVNLYPPDPAIIDLLQQQGTPNGLEFDTYIGMQFVTQGWPASDVGAPPDVYQPNVSGITYAWGMPQYLFDDAGLSSSGTNLAARITISDDAEGTWSFGATEGSLPHARFLDNPITAGQMSYVPMPGDLTHDAFVGIEDLNNILGHWNQSVETGGKSDPSGDGYAGVEDLNVVLGNWNAGTARRPILTTPMPWGDLNGDGFVGYIDIKQLNAWWGYEIEKAGNGYAGDPSGDGYVGIDDLSIIMDTYYLGVPPTFVPEPMSASLVALGMAVIGTQSRRFRPAGCHGR